MLPDLLRHTTIYTATERRREKKNIKCKLENYLLFARDRPAPNHIHNARIRTGRRYAKRPGARTTQIRSAPVK